MPCPSCRFDPAAWTDDDLRRTLDVVPLWFAALREGADDAVLADLAPFGERLADLPRGDSDVAAVHQAWHVLAAAGRVRHRAAGPAAGHVVRVGTSAGGVPKRAMDRAVVTAAGLAGDAQADRRHHGRPWQAVSLWSLEVLAALAAEGHPIGPGDAGENLTLAGLDWETVRPGVRLRAGTTLLEVTTYAVPCQKIAHLFLGGRFRRIAHGEGPARVYARVLADGEVAPGDAVLLEPAGLAPQRPGNEAPCVP